MPAQTPSVGRIVHYQLTEHDATDINRRRQDFHQSRSADERTGFVGHVGNHAAAGDVYPAVIVRVWSESTTTCNLQVLLDGTDTYWATSRAEGSEAGTWAWPERA
ncbi:hypothetical protein [Streptomyces sp. L2]|uniref:hypothetical protein n=1 Tax=Streptomyces sp. L2 TaxID=2162665 RepID=UPI0010129B24|nr:hypothetical protein [Streptomyces sp. L2]